MALHVKDYMADYDPLIGALGGVGAAIPAPDFYGQETFATGAPAVPSSIQALAQDPAPVSEQALAQPLAPRTPVVRPIAAPESPEIRDVRDPVNMMAGARQEAQAARQRGNLAGLVDALITGGANRQMLSQQAQQQAQEALQMGQIEQQREDAAVAQARKERQAQLKAKAAGDAAQAKAALADPNSPQSLALQASLRQSPMGQHLGEETIRRITPANLKQYSQVLSEAQKGAAQTREDARFDEDKKKRLAEALEKQQLLMPGELKKRRAGATIVATGRMDLARQMEDLKAQKRLEAKKEERTYKHGEDVKKQAKDYGKALIASNIPDQQFRINKAKESAQAAIGKRGEVFSNADFLLWKGGGAKAIGAMSKEGKEVAEQFQGILNITLKDRSGAAVTNPEFERLKAELGAGLFSTEADLMRALDRIGEIVEEHKIAQMARFDPEAVSLYETRERGARAKTKPVKSGRVRVKHPDGRVGTIDASKLAAAKKAGYEEI